MVTAARHGFELGILGIDDVSFSSFAGDPKTKNFFGMKALLVKQDHAKQAGPTQQQHYIIRRRK